MIGFFCTQCGKRLSAEEQFRGRPVRCDRCGKLITVPPIRASGLVTAPPTPVVLPKNLHPKRDIPRPRAPQNQRAALKMGIILLVVTGSFAFLATVNLLRHSALAPPFSPVPRFVPHAPALPAAPVFPWRPRAVMEEPGIDSYSMTIAGTGPGLPMRIKLYLPADAPARHSLPCVFIAPAGTRLVHGMRLASDATPEHLPYVRAGFCVLAYELSGDVRGSREGQVKFRDLREPIRRFMEADGGLANAKWAVEYVLARVPEVDPNQLYAAGHSSAGTMALNLAASDARIRGVAAYAPACDVVSYWGDGLETLDRMVPGTRQLAEAASPIRHVDEFGCPIFLFHADDDHTFTTQSIEDFAGALRAEGKPVTFLRVQSGGHYQSMINQGIPAGISWLHSLAAGAYPEAPRTLGRQRSSVPEEPREQFQRYIN